MKIKQNKMSDKIALYTFTFNFLLVSVILFNPLNTRAQQPYEVKQSEIIYKKIDGIQLKMNVYVPVMKKKEMLPAIVFFHGGGWNIGNIKLFELQARYLASRGMVAFCPEYRLASKHKTTVVECVKDARSVIRYIRSHAQELGISPAQIIASGASAGGHLAASLGTINEFNEASDDLKVSAVPNALVLFCPAVRIERETLNDAYKQRFAGQEEALSPYNHIQKNMPATIIMSGDKDNQVRIESVRDFKNRMEAYGNACKLIEYAGQGHGFAHFDKSPDFFKRSLGDTESFLETMVKFKGSSWLDQYIDLMSKNEDAKNKL